MPFASGDHAVGSVIDYDSPVYFVIYALSSALQLLMSYLLFRFNRFKKGFPFLLKGYAIFVALIAAGAVLIFTTWGKTATQTDDAYATTFLLAGIFIIGIGVIIWIRWGIKTSYMHWIRDNNLEHYKKTILQKDAELKSLRQQTAVLLSANHSIRTRLAALERGYALMLEKARAGGAALEIAEEIALSAEDVRRAARDYEKDAGRGKGAKLLPSTRIKMLDDIFGLFEERCREREIAFDLVVNGSIPYMTEKVIGQSRLETLIGDHLEDALAAVGAGGHPFRSILATLGLADGCYALTVFDSGVPFAAGTLIRLGTEPVTSRAESGGSGEGFMKTFETMRECGASLIIDEKAPGCDGHSKSVTVRFDGKGRYVIETYRPGEFPPCDRYTVIGRGER